MKKIFYTTLLLLVGLISMQAQEGPNAEDMQKMQEKQIKKMTKDLKLDDDTKAKFTELYRQYLAEKQSVSAEMRDVMRSLHANRGEEPSDAQIEALMKVQIKQERANVELKEKYYEEFRKILNPKQVQMVLAPSRGGNDNRNNNTNRTRRPGGMGGGFGGGFGGGMGGGFGGGGF